MPRRAGRAARPAAPGRRAGRSGVSTPSASSARAQPAPAEAVGDLVRAERRELAERAHAEALEQRREVLAPLRFVTSGRARSRLTGSGARNARAAPAGTIRAARPGRARARPPRRRRSGSAPRRSGPASPAPGGRAAALPPGAPVQPPQSLGLEVGLSRAAPARRRPRSARARRAPTPRPPPPAPDRAATSRRSGQRASASPSRIPAWMPSASAAPETSPTTCSRSGSGASATGLAQQLLARAQGGQKPETRDQDADHRGHERMFAYGGLVRIKAQIRPMIVRVSTDLACSADAAWAAVQRLDTFRYVTRGLLGFRVPEGTPEELEEGMVARGRLLFFHVLPAWNHEIRAVRVDRGRAARSSPASTAARSATGTPDQGRSGRREPLSLHGPDRDRGRPPDTRWSGPTPTSSTATARPAGGGWRGL